MDLKKSDNIQNVLDDYVLQKQASGLNLLVYKDNNEIGYWQSGVCDIQNKRPYQRDTIVRLFSMTKPVTAAAAMILVEEGKLDLANEVGEYLPEFRRLTVCTEKGRNGKARPAVKPLFVQDLLNMTGGYTYGAWNDESPLGEHLTSDLIAELNSDVAFDNKITTREVANRLSKIPLSYEPGTDYSYGLCADILGAVIEQVSGRKFSDFLKERIFYPLGMYDTDFYVPLEKQSRLANAYRSVLDEKSNARRLELYTECNLGIQNKMDKVPSFESGGAGLCSTVDDYMKFALMMTNLGELDGKRILSQNTIRHLSEAHLTPKLQSCFDSKMPHLSGYTYCNLLRVAAQSGACNVLTKNGEFGWDGWLGPYVSMDINNHLTFVLTMQRCDAGRTTAARCIHNILYSAL